MNARLLAIVNALEAAGITHGGAWQLAQAQMVTSANDRQRLSQVLATVLAPRAPGAPAAMNGAVFSTRGGIRMTLED